MKIRPPKKSVRSFITYRQLWESYNFNNKMMNGDLRNHSKDDTFRPLDDESLNDLMGKIAEFAVYNRFIHDKIECPNPPSIKDYGKGESDPGYDLIIYNYLTIDGNYRHKSTIDVKSSKLIAGSMMLPCLKYHVINGKVLYRDNENSKNNKIPNLFIAVNVGRKGLKSYKRDFNKLVYKICCNNKESNKPVPSRELTLDIKGVLDDNKLAKCVINKTSLFKGVNYYIHGEHHKKCTRGEYIPTSKSVSKYNKLHKDNYVFPYWYIKSLNPGNKRRRVQYMNPVYF